MHYVINISLLLILKTLSKNLYYKEMPCQDKDDWETNHRRRLMLTAVWVAHIRL